MLEMRRIDRILGIVVDLGTGLAHPRGVIGVDRALAVAASSVPQHSSLSFRQHDMLYVGSRFVAGRGRVGRGRVVRLWRLSSTGSTSCCTASLSA